MIESNNQEDLFTEVSAPRERSTGKRKNDLFGKAMLREAIRLLPTIPETNDLLIARHAIRENLPTSAKETRRSDYRIKFREDLGLIGNPIQVHCERCHDEMVATRVEIFQSLRLGVEPMVEKTVISDFDARSVLS